MEETGCVGYSPSVKINTWNLLAHYTKSLPLLQISYLSSLLQINITRYTHRIPPDPILLKGIRRTTEGTTISSTPRKPCT